MGSLLACVLIFVLQANDVHVNWMVSLVLYGAVALGCVGSLLRHAVPHFPRWARYLCALMVLIFVGVLGTIGTTKAYRSEHLNQALAQSPPPDSEQPASPAQQDASPNQLRNPSVKPRSADPTLDRDPASVPSRILKGEGHLAVIQIRQGTLMLPVRVAPLAETDILTFTTKEVDIQHFLNSTSAEQFWPEMVDNPHPAPITVLYLANHGNSIVFNLETAIKVGESSKIWRVDTLKPGDESSLYVVNETPGFIFLAMPSSASLEYQGEVGRKSVNLAQQELFPQSGFNPVMLLPAPGDIWKDGKLMRQPQQ